MTNLDLLAVERLLEVESVLIFWVWSLLLQRDSHIYLWEDISLDTRTSNKSQFLFRLLLRVQVYLLFLFRLRILNCICASTPYCRWAFLELVQRSWPWVSQPWHQDGCIGNRPRPCLAQMCLANFLPRTAHRLTCAAGTETFSLTARGW